MDTILIVLSKKKNISGFLTVKQSQHYIEKEKIIFSKTSAIHKKNLETTKIFQRKFLQTLIKRLLIKQKKLMN